MARQTKIISFEDARGRSSRSASSGRSRRSYTDEELDRAYETATNARERRRAASAPERRTSSRRPSDTARSRDTESSRQQRQRARTKARADKMFDRQFGGQAAAEPAEGTPRAAVYEGKMGRSQRKSARMQRASSAGSSSVKLNPAGWFSGISITPRRLYVATAVICVLLVGVFLYTPAQHYYQAQRDRDRLAVEYSLIQERNDALDAQNDELASDSGMEDAVRKKYGYVKPGEEVVVVTGLSDSATDSSRGNEQIEPAVLSSTVKAPEYWYTPLLDTFFGVE